MPFDHASAGLIADDRLRALYAAFPAGMHLLVIMDCCHSGTISRGLDVIDRFIEPGEAEQARIHAAKQAWAARRERLIVEQLCDVSGRATDDRELHETARRIALLARRPDDRTSRPTIWC